LDFYIKKAIETIGFDGMTTGFVVCHDEENKKAGVQLPKFMPHVPQFQRATYYTEDIIHSLDSSAVINSESSKLEFSPELKECNYYWVNPMEWVKDWVHVNDTNTNFGAGHDHPKTNPYEGTAPFIHENNNRQVANFYSPVPPSVGEEILCVCLDSDPQKMYWLPYSPSMTGK
jgi:hypothetical protein